AQIARCANFTKTTTHRVLASLRDVNFVVQEPKSRGYRLGPALAQLAMAGTQQEVSAHAQPILHRLAGLCDDTVFVSIPQGNGARCVGRKVGSFPIRTLTLARGDRRPLGVGAGSLALYCVMPEAVRRAVCRQNAEWMAEYGDFNWQTLEAHRREFLDTGYALNRGGIVPGMSAIAVPVAPGKTGAAASLTIAAINERMTSSRIDNELAPLLKREAERLARSLAGLPWGDRDG
ncbi:MAG: IclR family transcriptional regulator, partial [Hyphomicrobiales bacterium]